MKTVYILGAGFSMSAGAPSQEEVMKKAFENYRANPDSFDKNHFNRFEKFLAHSLYLLPNQYESLVLEDIFTPLDRCLAENSQFRGLDVAEIMKVRESVFHVVAMTIKLELENTKEDKSYVEKFARYLVTKSKVRREQKFRDNDPVSVISANWDLLLDNALYEVISRDFRGDAVVDYCCYISSLDEDDRSIMPGLEMLGKGGFNTKLLKVHGSINWLQCSRCMRLYAKFGEKTALSQTHYCRHCDKNFKGDNGSHPLASNLIMPTFIKDLSNPQYKIIWQNAGVEISEANNLVFIGYSLPAADFEMRQLLSRMTRRDAKIEVVDFSKDEFSEPVLKAQKAWKTFFGEREITFHYDGAVEYINSELI